MNMLPSSIKVAAELKLNKMIKTKGSANCNIKPDIFGRWSGMTLLTPKIIALILESPKQTLGKSEYVNVLLAVASIFIYEFPLRLSTVYKIEERDIIFPLESNDVYTVYQFEIGHQIAVPTFFHSLLINWHKKFRAPSKYFFTFHNGTRFLINSRHLALESRKAGIKDTISKEARKVYISMKCSRQARLDRERHIELSTRAGINEHSTAVQMRHYLIGHGGDPSYHLFLYLDELIQKHMLKMRPEFSMVAKTTLSQLRIKFLE